MAARERLGDVLRAGQWREVKILPALAIAYATALVTGTTLTDAVPAIVILLVALVSGGAGVSILNDIADRAEDAAAGKANRMAGRSMADVAIIAALPLGGTALAAWLWRGNAPALLAMAGAWACFVAYSLPPVRLKGRAAWGVVADAGGAHLFPALMAVFTLGAAAPLLWSLGVAAWAMALGLRGIIAHQLADEAHDRASGSASMVVTCGRERARRFARHVAFPVECAALAAMLWQIGRPEPLYALALAALFVVGRVIYFQMRPVVAEPVARYFILGQDYYTVLLPLALLVAATRMDSGDGVVMMMHLAAFPVVAATLAWDGARIITRAVRGHHLIGR